MLRKNTEFYKQLQKDPSKGKFFTIDMIHKILLKISEIKDYAIIFINHYPFLPFILNKFLGCYCYSEIEVKQLLEITTKIRFKMNDDDYNNQIRYLINNIYYISQNILIDLILLNSSNKYDNCNESFKEIIKQILFF